jgi:hypothetical protein
MGNRHAYPTAERRTADRYGGPIARLVNQDDAAPMTAKRILAAVLWFYAGWYAGATIAYFLGVSEVLGPILGTATAGLIAGDPRGIIWTVRSERIERRIRALAAQPSRA